MKLYQRHIKAGDEFIEALVLGSLGLARGDVYATSWEINGNLYKLGITLNAGKTVSLVDIRRMQRTVESFTTLYGVHFGSTITLTFETEVTESGRECVKLAHDKAETEEDDD